MYETLFGSKTRVKLLALLLTNTGRAFYVREITRTIDEQINSVRRELLNLKSIGLVKSNEKKGKIYYEANTKFEFYSELKRIFEKTGKTPTGEDKVTFGIRKSGDISYAALMGAFVGDTASQVDLFVVGEVDKRKMKSVLANLEKELKREVNYCVMTLNEYEDRKMLFDRFLTELMASPKKILIDSLEEETKKEGKEEKVDEE
ncbi:MAG: transcriptional regulator [Patescibacteria group bacterium]|jgi:DNA-binding transcriptional ArsR family regulator|nr:transcriptional regulator [Patescibacteria group bacterium]